MKRIKKQFWLSEKENADFMKKVELSGLSQSAVLRILIKGYEPREKPDDRFYDLMRQFYAMSNNLNQIAIKANSLGFVDTRLLKDKIDKLTNFSLKLKRNTCIPKRAVCCGNSFLLRQVKNND